MKITYYTAPWCAPCKQLLPKVKAEAERWGLGLDIINIDDGGAPQHIKSVPTIEICTEPGVIYELSGPAAARFKEILGDLP